jgi:galactose mutarotase-like enzyme
VKNTIANDKITFVSDSFNVEPWELRFSDDNVNYFWHTPPGESLGTAVCFPLLGSLPDNKYMLHGKEYRMGMHGFAHNRDFEIVEKSESSITYEITDNRETLVQYPYKFRLQVVYTVEGTSLKTEYRVKNCDDKELYFSVGGHPRYACPIGGEGRFEDYYFEFAQSESTKNIVKSFGPIEPIEECLGGDGKSLRLDYSMFTKGCFCFHPFNSDHLILKSEKTERRLKMSFNGMSHLQFWTSQGNEFIAIEPWYGSITSIPAKSIESIWKERPGTLHIAPGDEYRTAYDVTISR